MQYGTERQMPSTGPLVQYYAVYLRLLPYSRSRPSSSFGFYLLPEPVRGSLQKIFVDPLGYNKMIVLYLVLSSQ